MKLILVFALALGLPIAVFGQSGHVVDSTLKADAGIVNREARLNALYNHAIKYRQESRDENLFANAFWHLQKQHPVDSNLAKGLYLLADVELGNGAYEACLKHSLRSLDIAKAQNMFALQVDLLSDIGGVYLRMDNIEESLKAIEEARAIAVKHKFKAKEIRMINYQSMRYAMMEKTAKALALIDTGKTLAKKYGLENELYELLTTEANIYIHSREEPAKAISILLQALPIARRIGPTENAVIAYMTGKTYTAMLRKPEIAEKYYDEAVALLANVDDPDLKVTVYAGAFRTAVLNSKPEKANNAINKYERLRDSLFSIEKIAAIQDIKTKYETDIKDARIQAQGEQLNLNKRINIFLAISVAFAITIGAIIFITLRRTRKLNIEIARLNGVKDRLFSTISHDMQEPINSLLSFTVLLESGNIQAEKISLYAGELKNSLSYTSGLMTNLLQFSRSQIQGFNPRMQKFDVFLVAEETVLFFEQTALQKNITLTSHIKEGVTVFADVSMVQLVLRNLINNAIKFTGTNGSVIIGSKSDKPDVVCLYIQDDGIGISAEKVMLFNTATDANTQPLATTLGTANEKGTGLGLLLCKNFAAVMGATLKLESTPGTGTTFTFCLKKA